MAHKSATISCPYCFAEISREARKCCYCGEWVDERQRPAQSRGGSGQSKPAHEVIQDQFDEAVRTDSVVFAVVTLVLFFVWPPAGFIASLIGVFTGPRKGCFGAMLVFFIVLPIVFFTMGIALTGGILGGLSLLGG